MSDVALDKNQWNRLNGKLDVDPIDVPADYTFNDGLRQRLYFTGDEANPSVDDIKMVYGYPGGAEDTITGWKAIYSARDKMGIRHIKDPTKHLHTAKDACPEMKGILSHGSWVSPLGEKCKILILL